MKITTFNGILIGILVVGLLAFAPAGLAYEAGAISVVAQATEARPFRLPFLDPPGPSTWLLGQTYGNTTGAYRQRRIIYEAGQGVHLGVD